MSDTTPGTTPITTLNATKGTYLLLLKATQSTKVQIGKLGELSVNPGFYVYSGSAFGPGGLGARVGRHLRLNKKLRWHIDYLRPRVDDVIAYYQPDSRSECLFAYELMIAGGEIPMKGFGSSDCKCESHLVYFIDLAPFTNFITDNSLRSFHV
jgi:Uri superfamily endonuclease